MLYLIFEFYDYYFLKRTIKFNPLIKFDPFFKYSDIFINRYMNTNIFINIVYSNTQRKI